MKLLLDANISWRLAARLKNYVAECLHADNIGLAIPEKDIDIWNCARLHDLIIITNDEDFVHLVNIKGFPPKIVLLRKGNQSTAFIEKVIIKHIADIVDL